MSIRSDIADALDCPNEFAAIGTDYLPSKYAVTNLACASIGAVGCALSRLMTETGLCKTPPKINIDRRLAALWFGWSIAPIGWEMPPVWDDIAGLYKAKDGWIRLHTNADHHKAAALKVLAVNADRGKVESAVAARSKDELEQDIVNAGGVAAAMRSRAQWAEHPQGLAIAREPLIHWGAARKARISAHWQPSRDRPLNGLRVLDLTRVLAGPVATRTLAGFGANVLRIDPLVWEEANVVPDITLGKRCARLDLRAPKDRKIFEDLLASADVLVHGYRSGALRTLGYGENERQKIAPSIIDARLNAYGHTGPWRERRGYDSLVQMSCGIADAGAHWAGADTPTPLPVQALDHSAGYLLAASVIRALTKLVLDQTVQPARLSLARTAELLCAYPQDRQSAKMFSAEQQDFNSQSEMTPWGPAWRLRPALTIEGTPMAWDHGATALGSSKPHW